MVSGSARRSVEERVAALLGRMTLDEKVAQLGGTWLTELVAGRGWTRRAPASGSATASGT